MIRSSLIAVSLLVAVPALSQDRAALRDACQADFAKNCPGVRPGGGRLVACFKEKQASFSQGCKAAMQSAQAQRQTN